jgi:hypothetical protein
VLHASAKRIRALAAIGSGLALTLLSGCSASPPPLTLLSSPGNIACVYFPGPVNHVTDWGAPVGFTLDMYVNLGHQPATVQSLALADSHGLVLHGGLVYELAHSKHALSFFGAWPSINDYANPAAWRARQPIPGAVVPTGHTAHVLTDENGDDNLYDIVEEVSATSPSGGWAGGLTVTYTSGGTSYSTTAITGIALASSRVPEAARCHAEEAAIKSDFQHRGVHPSMVLTGYYIPPR